MTLPGFTFVNDNGRRFYAEYDPECRLVTFFNPVARSSRSFSVNTFMIHRGTLRLHTEIPEWTLSETNVLDVQAWIAKLDSQTY